MYYGCVNINPETGVRFGVIALQSIDPDLVDDLWYGPGAVNVTEQEVAEDARREFESDWENHKERAEIAATETDPGMSDAEREDFIEKWFEVNDIDSDKQTYVERRLERFWNSCDIEQPHITGTYEGVKYKITWLGGAPLLWILEGPLGFAEHLCSICVPNAADLDSGYKPTNLKVEEIHRDHDGYLCYVVPQDWLYKEDA